jgi:hypothetical protein
LPAQQREVSSVGLVLPRDNSDTDDGQRHNERQRPRCLLLQSGGASVCRLSFSERACALFECTARGISGHGPLLRLQDIWTRSPPSGRRLRLVFALRRRPRRGWQLLSSPMQFLAAYELRSRLYSHAAPYRAADLCLRVREVSRAHSESVNTLKRTGTPGRSLQSKTLIQVGL